MQGPIQNYADYDERIVLNGVAVLKGISIRHILYIMRLIQKVSTVSL